MGTDGDGGGDSRLGIPSSRVLCFKWENRDVVPTPDLSMCLLSL